MPSAKKDAAWWNYCPGTEYFWMAVQKNACSKELLLLTVYHMK
jgi:hypothetical protein